MMSIPLVVPFDAYFGNANLCIPRVVHGLGVGRTYRCLDMNRSEPAIVNGTREVHPGLIMTGECSLLLSKHHCSILAI
jgi:hypothetical protein